MRQARSQPKPSASLNLDLPVNSVSDGRSSRGDQSGRGHAGCEGSAGEREGGRASTACSHEEDKACSASSTAAAGKSILGAGNKSGTDQADAPVSPPLAKAAPVDQKAAYISATRDAMRARMRALATDHLEEVQVELQMEAPDARFVNGGHGIPPLNLPSPADFDA